MKKTLRKPEYWTDFEDLCKRLWEEIWDYPETKKHGRTGQKQQGIDVYGKESRQKGFIGIQCKGKDEYSAKQLTKKEIDREIEKAKTFVPPLGKMYFATTSNRSAKIEEYIRTKSEGNISQGLFSIHIYFWEDIAELIDQNKTTHDWYIQGKAFNERYNVAFSFDTQTEEVSLFPIYEKYVIRYSDIKLLDLIDTHQLEKDLKLQPKPFGWKPLSLNTKSDLLVLVNELIPIDSDKTFLDPQPKRYNLDQFFQEFVEVKRSVGCINLILTNTGPTSISKIKLTMRFEGMLSVDSVDKNRSYLDLLSTHYDYNVSFPEENLGVVERRVLVPGDSLRIDEICFMTMPEDNVYLVPWRLYSKEYQTSGVLKINIKPEFSLHETENYVDQLKAFQSEMIRCQFVRT